jgi:guanosine-3',5'-bis(diphosphate) 3'-pyrophosphohydrolase
MKDISFDYYAKKHGKPADYHNESIYHNEDSAHWPTERLLDAVMYAALCHQAQKRKDAAQTPYIVHPLTVAHTLLHVGHVIDIDVLIAAVLHDVVEDTDATIDDVRARFGDRVAGLVAEVTDDKTLAPSAVKRSQIERVRHASDGAKLIKMADKISNVWDVRDRPTGWTMERMRGYACWSQQVALAASSVNVAPHDGLFAMLEEILRLPMEDNGVAVPLLPPTEAEQDACLAAFYLELDAKKK